MMRPMRVYVSAGTEVADCPRCGRLRGVVFGAGACCPNCFELFTVEHHGDHADAVDVLAARPDPETRNWRPDLGETVDNLRGENAAHGLV